MPQIEAFLALITQASSLAGWGLIVNGVHALATGGLSMGLTNLLAGGLAVLKAEKGTPMGGSGQS